MPRLVGIMSNKGGVGKTATVVNLGVALTFFARDVTIVDANLSSPTIGTHLGSPSVPISLNHVLTNKNTIEDATYVHRSGMKVIPSSLRFGDFDSLSMAGFRNHIFKSASDIVLIDSAPG